jgi:NAD(P)-dependent dehydrogenase (short-subunit alcohol dehydrogenase family)
MSDRAALVTGGSSGIGLAIACALGKEGYRLTIAARQPERLGGAVERLRAGGATVEGVAADVGREEDAVALIARHRELYGRLDVLVNNAGVGIGGRLEEIRTEHLDTQLAVNLRGTVLCTREALPLLRQAGAEHGEALIVNVASIAGKLGAAGLAVYAATKAAAINFTRSTHREVGGAGIQCTALAPGFVDTPMTEYVKRRIPAEEMIQPSDIAEAVLFLLRTSPNCHVPEIVFT